LGYSGFAKVVLKQGNHAFAIFDERMFEIAMQEEEFAELHAHGGLKQGETVGEVARAQGVDAAAAAAAVAAYNAAAAGERPDDLGRTEFGLAPLVPPFYSCRARQE